MSRSTRIQMLDFDSLEEDEQKLQQRRIFMYSPAAIRAAAEVDRRMVNYQAFADAMQGIDRVFQLGRELTVQQGLSVTGPSGSGKTALARYFLSSLPKSTLFEDGYGAFAIRLPSRPTVGQVVGTLLRRLRYPFPQVNGRTLDAKRQVLIDAFGQKGTRLIFVDEAHHLLAQGRAHARDAAVFGNVSDLLRELMDEARVALVLLGTDELDELARIDEHLANRVSARLQLKGLDSPAHWHGFVRSFIRSSSAVDLGFLSAPVEAQRLYTATHANLRSFKRLVTEAVLVALDDGKKAVAVEHLRLAYDRVNGKDAGVENPYAAG